MHRHLLLSAAVLFCASCIFSGGAPPDDAVQNNENNANNINNENNGTTAPNNPDNNPPNNLNNRPVNNPPNNVVDPPMECPQQWLDGPYVALCQMASNDFGQTPLSNPPPPPDFCEDPGCPSCDPTEERGMLCIPRAFELMGAGFGAILDVSQDLLITGGVGGTPITVIEAVSGVSVGTIATAETGARAAVAGSFVAVTNPGTRALDIHSVDPNGIMLLSTLGVDEGGFGSSIVGRQFGTIAGFMVGSPEQNSVYAALGSDVNPFNLFDGLPITASVPLNARFGQNLALDATGNTLAVLSPGTQSVFIFMWDDNAQAWLEAAEVQVSMALSNLSDIALNGQGTLLAVSDAAGVGARVELFSAANGWQSVQTFDGSQVGVTAGFGVSVALAGNVVYVGAPVSNLVAMYIGTPDLGYYPAGAIMAPNGMGGQFGANIAVSNTRLALGGPRLSGEGHVWVGRIGSGL